MRSGARLRRASRAAPAQCTAIKSRDDGRRARSATRGAVGTALGPRFVTVRNMIISVTMCSNMLFIFLAEKWLRIRNQKWQDFSSLRPRARCSAQRATRARAQSTQLARSTKRVRTHANNRTRSAPHSAAQRSQTQDVKPQRRAPYHGAAHRIITAHATSQRRTTHDNTSPPTTLHHNTTQHNATHETQRQADAKLGYIRWCRK